MPEPSVVSFISSCYFLTPIIKCIQHISLLDLAFKNLAALWPKAFLPCQVVGIILNSRVFIIKKVQRTLVGKLAGTGQLVTPISCVSGFSFFVFPNLWASILENLRVQCIAPDFLFKSGLAQCAQLSRVSTFEKNRVSCSQCYLAI